MSVTLGHNQYGEAETRVVRVYRDTDHHEIVDDNASVALSSDFADIQLTGDNNRPYGFIKGTAHKNDALRPGLAFGPGQGR